MKRLLLILLIFELLSTSHFVFSQLNFNGGIKLIISGGTSTNMIFTVLNSPPLSPIVTSGSTDGIILEGEFNRLQYNLSTATTAITVPYMSSALESFPLIVTPTASGVGTGNIRFSTTKAVMRNTGWDNLSYLPSDVTNMGGTNNSNNTIDRFWIIDANGYSTKPSVNLSFTYIDAEWATNGSNTITESDLRAQRFNNSINSWESFGIFPPTGVINTTTNVVSNVSVSGANFYKSWTLTTQAIPLPVQLVSFESECFDNGSILFNWTTSSEVNNDFFTIERSFDGDIWEEVSTIEGAGTSYQTNEYSYLVSLTSLSIAYYRLKQTDFDGYTDYSAILYPNCFAPNTIYLNSEGDIMVEMSTKKREEHTISIFNSIGQIVCTSFFISNIGFNQFKIDTSQLSTGIYYLQLESPTKVRVEKIMIYKS